MKRLVLACVFACLLSAFGCKAQPKSVGLVATCQGLEFCYQHDIFPGFLEVDAGVAGSNAACPGLRLGASYNFRLMQKNLAGGNFVMYIGPGIVGGLYSEMCFTAAAYAQYGVEYGFTRIPLEIALDIRPAIWFEPTEIAMDMASVIPSLGIRWRF